MSQGRVLITLLLVVSLLLTAATRQLSDRQRYRVLTRDGQQPLSTAGGGNLSGMDSFALALLLGGLRGPLVMILWQQSESQKQQKNLEGFDTQVEWIRMLQPEFDSVHIFQVWNKAYNISVQMASLANKYITILDALDYAYRTDAERPHNINILTAIAQVYFDKLGNSQEKDYYRDRVRAESQWREQTTDGRAATVRMTRLEPRLDPEGRILPQFLRGTLQRPASRDPNLPWNTGADLQYLEPLQPFPYGISPFAFAYNYHKRSQVLQASAGQIHAQLSPTVIDSRPALAMRFWAEEEFERSRRLEAAMLDVRPYTEAEQELRRPFGHMIVEPLHQFDVLTADLPATDTPLEDARLEEILYSYNRTVELGQLAIVEYELHMRKSGLAFNVSTYESHIDDVRVLMALAAADRSYLLGLSAPAGSAERQTHLRHAASQYREMIDQCRLVMLRYFTDIDVMRRIGLDRDKVRDLTPQQRAQMNQRAQDLFAIGIFNPHEEDRAEYDRYIQRAETRLDLIAKSGTEID